MGKDILVEWCSAVLGITLELGRGDKLENFDLIFFPTSKTWKGLLTTD